MMAIAFAAATIPPADAHAEPAARRRADKATVTVMDLAHFKQALAEVSRRPGTRAVFVNVWATWCEPCREEMPDIVRFAHDRHHRDVRVVLVSADSVKQQAAVTSYLTSLGVDFPSYLKSGDDMEFINGIDPTWDGTIPASWLFDPNGRRMHLWSGALTYDQLSQRVNELFPPSTAPGSDAKTKPKRNP